MMMREIGKIEDEVLKKARTRELQQAEKNKRRAGDIDRLRSDIGP